MEISIPTVIHWSGVDGGTCSTRMKCIGGLLIAVLLLPFTLVADLNSLVVTNDSPAFSLDTRQASDAAALVVQVETSAFVLDTGSAAGNAPINVLVVLAESAPFSIDTRLDSGVLPSVSTVVVQSGFFILDTRLSTDGVAEGHVVFAETPQFTLDLRLPEQRPGVAELVVQTESGFFTLDTRVLSEFSLQDYSVVAESAIFTIDTRLESGTSVAGLIVMAESPGFALDTQPSSENPLYAALVAQTESGSFTLDTSVPAPLPIDTTLIVETVSAPFTIDTLSGWVKVPDQTLAGGTASGKIRFSPDGLRLAKTDGNRVLLWNLHSTKAPVSYTGHGAEVASVEFSPLGDQILTGGADGTLRWWDTANRNELGRTNPPGVGAVYAAYASDGARILAGRGASVSLYGVPSMQWMQDFPGTDGSVTALALSPEGLALAGNSSRSALIWDTAGGLTRHRLTNHRQMITAAAFFPGGTSAMTASLDGTVRIWDTATGAELLTIQQGSPVADAALSPDGHLLVSCESGNWIQVWNGRTVDRAYLWDAQSGALLRVFSDANITSPMKGVAISPDHTALATTYADGSVRLWNTGLEPRPSYPVTPLSIASNAPVTLRSHGLSYFAVDVEAARSLVITLEADPGVGLVKSSAVGRKAQPGLSADAQFANLDSPAPRNPRDKSLQNPPPGADITAFRMTATKGHLPSVYDYETFAQASITNLHCEMPMVTTSTGKVYVLVFSPYLAAGSINTRIRAEYADFHLSSITPNRGGNAGRVTVKIQGTGLSEDTVASLINPAGGTIVGEQVLLADSTAMHVTFDLTAASIGPFHLQIEKTGIAPLRLDNVFQVVVGTEPRVTTRIDAPENIRSGRDYIAYLEIANTGDNDVAIPLLSLEHQGLSALRVSLGGTSYTERLLLFIPRQDVLLPFYPPGTITRVPLYLTTASSDARLTLSDAPLSIPAWRDHPVDYLALSRPPGFTPGEWSAQLSLYEQRYGVTTAGLITSTLQSLKGTRGQNASLYTFVGCINGRWTMLPTKRDGVYPIPPVVLTAEMRSKLVPTVTSRKSLQRASLNKANNEQASDTYVVIITGSDYAEARKRQPVGEKPIPDLSSGQAGQAVFDYYHTVCGLPAPSHVIFKNDGPGSNDDLDGNSIISAIREFHGMTQNDNLVIFYNGHGTSEGNWFLNNGDLKATALAAAINDGETKPKQLFVVSDSCFAGRFLQDLKSALNTPMVGFAATDDDSYSYGDSGGGIFGRTFIESLGEGASPMEAMIAATRVSAGCHGNLTTNGICIDINDQVPWLIANSQVDLSVTPWQPPPLLETQISGWQNFWNGWNSLAGWLLRFIRPIDPNDKIGPAGVGPNRVVSTNDFMEYLVRFENMAAASAPVQELIVVDYLDANLDWTTVEFEEIAYGDRLLTPPTGAQSFTLRDVPPPNSSSLTGSGVTNLAVNLSGMVNPQTGRLEWRVTAVDTNTGTWPLDALTGILPPENGTGRGQGHVRFRVKPKATTPFGTAITNIASIVFDNNDPIETPAVWNIIGDVPSLAATIAYLPGQLAVGTPFSYTITLTNTGTADIANTILTNTLPNGATILSGSTSFGSVTVTNGVLSWALGYITNGATATLTVTAMPTTGGTFNNQIEFTGGSGLAIFSAPSQFTIVNPIGPSLGIRFATDQVEISWTTNSSGFHLQKTPFIPPTSSWLDVTNTPTTTNQEYRLNLAIPQKSEFYRLIKP